MWQAAKDLRPESAAYVACALTTQPPARQKLVFDNVKKVWKNNIIMRNCSVAEMPRATDLVHQMTENVIVWYKTPKILHHLWFFWWSFPPIMNHKCLILISVHKITIWQFFNHIMQPKSTIVFSEHFDQWLWKMKKGVYCSPSSQHMALIWTWIVL